MRARAEIRVELRGGVSVVTTLAGQPPLLARQAPGEGPTARVNLVAGAGGPCAGDDLELRLVVGPGASVELRSVGATVALPGRPGAPASVLRTEVELDEGASLRFLPEPVVAATGCDHVLETTVRLAASARLVLREELVRGRSGEEPGGSLVARLRVERGGRPVLDQELACVPDPLLARTLGTLLSVSPACGDWDAAFCATLGAGGALAALAEPGAYVAAAVAADTVALRHLLDDALRIRFPACQS
jgi:urease accessory protein